MKTIFFNRITIISEPTYTRKENEHVSMRNRENSYTNISTKNTKQLVTTIIETKIIRNQKRRMKAEKKKLSVSSVCVFFCVSTSSLNINNSLSFSFAFIEVSLYMNGS